jgi:hypothetical protein
VTDEDPEVVRVHGYALDLERLTYATVVVVSVLAVYRDWDKLSFVAATMVVVAPILALAIAHAFSEVLHAHATTQRPMTGEQWRATAWHQVHLLLAAVPPLVVLAAGRLTRLNADNTRAIVLVTGLLTLVALTALASRRAGYRGWRWLFASLMGGVIGLVVILLQVVLKPK